MAKGVDVATLRKICQQINPPGRKPQGFQRGGGVIIPNLLPHNNFDEVLPRLVLGDQMLGLDPKLCVSRGITHVLNAAQGTKFGNVNTQETLFTPHGIKFMGIPANDTMAFNLSAYFPAATEFISNALAENEDTKIYIHCVQGISRSATILCAYLMMARGMSAVDALTTIRHKREVFPNQGFLIQLCNLETTLASDISDDASANEENVS